MFKLVHYKVCTVLEKQAVGILVECFLVGTSITCNVARNRMETLGNMLEKKFLGIVESICSNGILRLQLLFKKNLEVT